MNHFIERCKICNTVISQCRCSSPDKEQRWGICDKCKESNKPESLVIKNNNKFIEIGDIVDIFFENNNTIYSAKLLSIPFKQGDCFIVERMNDGSIYYVQNFSYMKKVMREN